MFSSTRPSSQSYQVAAVCGVPSGRMVATTAGFGFARKASTSGGTGTGGTVLSLARRLGALVGPALQALVRLPERHRLVVRVDVVAGDLKLLPAVGDELLLRCATLDRRRPVEQTEAQLVEMVQQVGGDAEVDQRKAARVAALDLAERRLPDVDV